MTQTWCTFAAAALFAAAAAAPIRVGVFTGAGESRYWHIPLQENVTAIEDVLLNPASANLGDSLVVPEDGFLFERFGYPEDCIMGCALSPAQKSLFLEALDSLDVVLFISNQDIGDIFTETEQRARIESLIGRQGVVSVHATTDSWGTWPQWDSLHGARFANMPAADRAATVRLDTLSMADPAWKFLNRGLPDTARFVEEWLSFTTSGSQIRAASGLKVLVNADEASYEGGLGGAMAMGTDHPLSWYRELPEGGRFFYTALGHRPQHYAGTGSSSTPATHFLRRQLYNAILWAAGHNEDGSVPTRVSEQGAMGIPSPSRFADQARASLSGGVLTVSLLRDGGHAIEVRGLDGRLVATRRGTGRGEHVFANLRSGVHLIAVTTSTGRAATLVTIP